MSTLKNGGQVVGHEALNDSKNEDNYGFCFHLHILVLLLLCAFTFGLSILVYKSIFPSEDKPSADSFITKPELVTLAAKFIGDQMHINCLICILKKLFLSFFTDNHGATKIPVFANCKF